MKYSCSFFHDLVITKINSLYTTNEHTAQVIETNVVNTIREWHGLLKFCFELEADWLIISDEVRWKSPRKSR